MSRVYITVAEHVDATLPILSQEWRAAHCVEGDKVLRMAAQVLFSTQPAAPEIDVRDLAMVLTAIAQAHYAAANVRAKPSQPRPAERNEYPTALELVDNRSTNNA